MVCNRCISAVSNELTQLGFHIVSVELGLAEIDKEPSKEELKNIRDTLLKQGFELLDDRKSKIIEQIKTLVIELVHYNIEEKPLSENYSDYLSKKIKLDYSYLSALFSSVENITIEKYIIQQKIESVKELLVYDELTLSEIAYQIGYSSVQHLSKQFKKVTGLTPSHFKDIKGQKRKPLDKI